MSARCPLLSRFALSLFALPLVASAQIVSLTPEAVEVTIYRARPGLTADVANMNETAKGIAMITETRTIDIPVGVSAVSFRGVAATIVPQSAKLESLPGQIVETNFDYSLIGPGELIAKSIGKSVRIIRTDTKTGNVSEHRATLLSGPDGVLLNIDGRIEALNCSGASERLVFDEVPVELTTDPTLSATVRATQSGRYSVRLSYLATGLDWSADYVARIHPDGRKLDLSGWITLANKQSTSFPNAQVHVVAGNVSVIESETVPQEVEMMHQADRCWPIGSFATHFSKEELTRVRGEMDRFQSPMMAAAPAIEMSLTAKKRMAEQSELGDYKLYTLPVSTTVAALQIKQVQMIDQHDVPFQRIYTYDVKPDEFNSPSLTTKPKSTLRLQNKKAFGLGVALPAGTATAMEATRTGLILTGEQTLKDLPVGLPVDIELGEAMNIAVRPRMMREYTHDSGDQKRQRTDIEIEIANDKSGSIQLELLHRTMQLQDFRVIAESKRHTLKYGLPMWALKLRAGERMILRYTLEQADPKIVAIH